MEALWWGALTLGLCATLLGCACGGGACGGQDDGCPEGARLQGTAPPEGTEQWCEKQGEEGVKHGNYQKWYPSGARREAGHYKDGDKSGEWTAWYEGGQINWQAEYYDGVKAGPYLAFFENGQKRAEGLYEDDEMDGRWRVYHKTGKLAEEGDYVGGRKDGRWTYYNNRGRKERLVTYKEGVEKKVKEVNPDGTEARSPGEVVNVPSEAVGREDERCKDGAKMLGQEPPSGFEMWCEKAGKKHGLYLKYWDNGNRWIEGEYTDGRKTGTWTEFYDNGIVTSKGQYASGRKTGPWVVRYPNNQVHQEGNYENGKKAGTWTSYHQDGRQKKVEEF